MQRKVKLVLVAGAIAIGAVGAGAVAVGAVSNDDNEAPITGASG